MIRPPCQQIPEPPPTNTTILGAAVTHWAADASTVALSARLMLLHRVRCSPPMILRGPAWVRHEAPAEAEGEGEGERPTAARAPKAAKMASRLNCIPCRPCRPCPPA